LPTGLPTGAVRIRVLNKIDLVRKSAAREKDAVWLSAKTGEGIELLRQALLEAAGWQRSGESVYLARQRHLLALEGARAHLVAAGGQQGRWELFAEELRLAQQALSAITGEFTSEDLLGEIFARFCIGK
jgi:tRNA modification GTPase